MRSERPRYPLRVLCSSMRVSRSGYYKWLRSKPSKRRQEDARLEVSIKAAHQRSRETYGTARIKDELAGEGIQAGRDRIGRLRKKLGLACRCKKKFKATTDSKHSLPVSPDHLGQGFTVFGPDEAWVSDITYVHTDEGWLYVAGVKDLFSREVVGYAMSSTMTKDLVCRALVKAVKARKPKSGLILHSDRGSQYCSTNYRHMLKQFGMVQSMSRKGNCYDNAPMESFWGTLKVELVHQRRYETRARAMQEITEYIEIFYNRIRRHSSLGNISPAAFLQKYYMQRKAA
jgi:putative transposase